MSLTNETQPVTSSDVSRSTPDNTDVASLDAYAVEITQHLRDNHLATDDELALITAYLLS